LDDAFELNAIKPATIAKSLAIGNPADGYVDTGIYWRSDLLAGDELSGPVIVEEYGSTVPVHPGFIVRVDAYGNLVITRESAK